MIPLLIYLAAINTLAVLAFVASCVMTIRDIRIRAKRIAEAMTEAQSFPVVRERSFPLDSLPEDIREAIKRTFDLSNPAGPTLKTDKKGSN